MPIGAVAVIRHAIENKAIIPDLLRGDPDLNTLRSREDFPLLMMDFDFPADPFAGGRCHRSRPHAQLVLCDCTSAPFHAPWQPASVDIRPE